MGRVRASVKPLDVIGSRHCPRAMRIKRVEIIGFKSFCDRAVVQIGEAITGVVGPNGCGKSNIVDAIRWCMGEQSAKHLRGKGMEDVIFAGSESRGPAPMAEVSLTFDDVGFSHQTLELARNSDEAEAEKALEGLDEAAAEATEAVAPPAPVPEDAPAPETAGVWVDEQGNRIASPTEEAAELLADQPPAFDFARYTEVTITRRLYRDGVSQYFINKTPCRLRDITDFFLGTGVGTKAYAIIEQGRIGQIVSSRPQDRRAIIEEAAGITKFKAKRKAAEKKLDQTRQNLMRVSDIVAELDKRMGTLRRQAQKAERYRKYKAEVRDIELWKSSHRWLELAGEGQLVAGRLGEARTELEDVRAVWSARDAHVVAERAELGVEERRLVGVQEKVYELDNRMRLAESKIGFERREADELDGRVAGARLEIDDLAGQRERGAAELAQRSEELAALEADVEREAGEVMDREIAAGEAKQQVANAQGRLDEARAELGRRRTEIATADAQLEALVRRRDEAGRRLERVTGETNQHRERQKELEREGRRVDGALVDLRQTRLDLGNQSTEFEERREQLADEVARGETQVETLRADLNRRTSRLASLREIQDRYEGFARGTRAIMQAERIAGLDLGTAIRGIVADVVRAPERLEVAVEAALGDRLGGVLVSQPEVGLAAIGFLKQGNGGRSAFVPLEPVVDTISVPAILTPLDVAPLSVTPHTAFEGEGGASSFISPAWDPAAMDGVSLPAAPIDPVDTVDAVDAVDAVDSVDSVDPDQVTADVVVADAGVTDVVASEAVATDVIGDGAFVDVVEVVATEAVAYDGDELGGAETDAADGDEGAVQAAPAVDAERRAPAPFLVFGTFDIGTTPLTADEPGLGSLDVGAGALDGLAARHAQVAETEVVAEDVIAPSELVDDAVVAKPVAEVVAEAEPAIAAEPAVEPEPVAEVAQVAQVAEPVRVQLSALPEGVLGRMADLVGFADGFEAVGRRLLGGTIVVESLDRAIALHRSGVKDRLVTIDGDVVDEDGVVAGGSRDAQGAGVLAQKREIRDLEEMVSRLEHELSEATTRLVSARAELKQLTKALEGLRKQVHEGDLAIMGHEKDETRIRADLDRYRDRLQHLGTEQLELEERLRAITADEEGIRGKRSFAEERIGELERIQLDLISLANEHRDRLDVLAQALTEARIRAAQLGEKRAAVEAQALRLQRTDAELAARGERLTSEIEDATRRATGLREGCDQLAAELVTVREERDGHARSLDEGRSAYQTRVTALTEVEIEVRELRSRGDRLATEVTQLEVRDGQVKLTRKVVEDQVSERYQLEIADVLPDYHQRSVIGETEDNRLTELRELIERMGTDINLTAIEEFADVSKRFEFLSAQKIDLERAVDQLQRAIDKINKTSRKLFKDTFTAVNATFKEVFPRLFRGGQAALSLALGNERGGGGAAAAASADGAPAGEGGAAKGKDKEIDLLEAGIEIMAQPPGKKNTTVDQLSGGEKALTAVALVFSIFLIKPSPFCILDEVDAPLDEANVDRYNELVREMTDRSQFIVITHNKRTMEAADNLYGVTMQEPGVSKLVSVNLSKLGSRTNGAAVRPPANAVV
ncbi:MAG: AAA family ATPase [Deltaproteobacteria bacterium]|nr:AAA family ATPase [Deltaproteobacteria bacterium]